MSCDCEQLQRSLLSGRWSEQEGISSQNVLVRLGKQVVRGDFRAYLRSPLSREVLALRPDALNDFSKPIGTWFAFSVPSAGGDYEQELVRLLTAVSCLHAFLQANWTGPVIDVDPLSLLDLPDEESSHLSKAILQQKATAELAYAGEPAYHLAQAAFLFRLAQILLDLRYDHASSAKWWRMRAWKVHAQLLGEPVAFPSVTFEDLERTLADEPDLVGQLWLERGLFEHYQSNDRAALECFVRAARTTGLRYELTGALGRRTKFQQTDLTQLVLLAESRTRHGDSAGEKKTEEARKEISSGATRDASDELVKKLPETLALNDDTLLEHTEFTSSNPAVPGSLLSHLDPSNQPALHPLDQCILLSLCLNVRKTSPAHGLTTEQMAPYVARVISHPENWSVHTMALLLRSRLEAHRTRTVERSTLQLQALIDQMPTADSTLAERLRLLHALPLPSKWELERELALRFLSLGVVKSALEIFERLEMWEEAIKCWQETEQRDRALAVVHDLLAGRRAEAETVLARGKASATGPRRAALDAAREAKLWCLLGELEPERAREHFEHAWVVSGETSGRAMRSLGGYFFSREEYTEAARCLRRAVAINPLFSRSWFILGCACIREQDWEGAREAFLRCVTIDEEDAESWNNLASVYLRMGYIPGGKKVSQGETSHQNDDEQQFSLEADRAAAIPFENKMLAFRALMQGLKFHYGNWRMWMNYTIVAMDVGEFGEACRALGRVVEERAAKVGPESVDLDVLDRLVDAATRGQLHEPGSAVLGLNEGQGLLRRVDDLFVRIILPRVSSSRIFRARARLLAAQDKVPEALEAYLESYRTSAAGRMETGETDLERWREGVREVEDIYDVLVNYGPKVEGSNWKLQARSIVRTFMGRTRDFEEEAEWSRLVVLLDDLAPSVDVSMMTTATTPPPLPRANEQGEPSLHHEQPRRRPLPRRYTMASFDNLVVLANYEERLREARKMVWRDRGEPAVEIHDLWECLEHGVRGGLRAGTLAFAIRSGVNLILLLARIQRVRKVSRKTRISIIQHALFGMDSFRFGAMLGSFVALYRILLNAFPLLVPANASTRLNLRRSMGQSPSPPRVAGPAIGDSPRSDSGPNPSPDKAPASTGNARLSSVARAHQTWLRKRSARWHSVVAGAVAGGVAISFEGFSRRTVIAQQLFVRGLQGSYNAYSEKRGFRVPHGDVLVFALSCAQIMYAFALRPDTLPKSYTSWINTAGQLPNEAVSMNRDMVRTRTFNTEDLESILSRPDLHRDNIAALYDWRATQPPYGPCSASHPHIASCALTPLDRFFTVFRWTLPIYGALHVVPMLLFKRKAVVRSPAPMILRAGWGTMRSAAFLGAFVAIYQAFFCVQQNAHRALVRRPYIPKWLLAMVVAKPSFWLGGLLSGLAVLIEAKHRRGELAMYVLPKGLESAWVAARGKGLVFRTGKHGSVLLTAIGMGMVMSTYQNDPQHLSGFVRRILYQFIGPN